MRVSHPLQSPNAVRFSESLHSVIVHRADHPSVSTPGLARHHSLTFALQRPHPATDLEISAFHSDDYVHFLQHVNPDNKPQYEKECLRCKCSVIAAFPSFFLVFVKGLVRYRASRGTWLASPLFFFFFLFLFLLRPHMMCINSECACMCI